jgi:hypothetical protein
MRSGRAGAVAGDGGGESRKRRSDGAGGGKGAAKRSTWQHSCMRRYARLALTGDAQRGTGLGAGVGLR